MGIMEEVDDAVHVKNLPASDHVARPSRATADLDAQFRDLDMKADSGSRPHTLHYLAAQVDIEAESPATSAGGRAQNYDDLDSKTGHLYVQVAAAAEALGVLRQVVLTKLSLLEVSAFPSFIFRDSSQV